MLFAAAIFVACFVAAALSAQVPQLVSYPGRVAVTGTNFDGSGQFKFALVNAAGTTTYWSYNGSSSNGTEPTAAVTRTVTNGLHSVGYAVIAGNVPDGAITGAKIASATITGANLASGSITGPNLANGSLTGAQLAPGAAAWNLGASGQSGVSSGGLVLSPVKNASLLGAGYIRIGTTPLPDSWQDRVNGTLPLARYLHTSVWTGSKIIVWGGTGASAVLSDGARFNLLNNA